MPTFYFHLKKGTVVTHDEEGSEFGDIAAAREEALACAREILGDAVRFGLQYVPDGFIIADASGRNLMTVTLSEVLPKQMQDALPRGT